MNMDREDRINRLLATEGTDVLGNNEEISKRLSRNGRVQEIPLEKLQPSPLNGNRTADENYIFAVADSIDSVGTLIVPLTVYALDDNNYRIISGHIRYAAWSRLASKNDKWRHKPLPCIVVKKPEDDLAEIELMTKANIHRNKRKDNDIEILIADDAWEHYIKPIPELHDKYVERYRNQFIEQYRDDARLLIDPTSFLSQYFRPRFWYIREQTGISLSNSQIKRILSSHAEELKTGRRSIAENSYLPERKKSRISSKRLQKRLDGFLPHLEWYFDQDDINIDADPEDRETLLLRLGELAAYIDKRLIELGYITSGSK